MAELTAVLDALAEGRSYRPTLNGLIRGWRELVEKIEAGYPAHAVGGEDLRELWVPAEQLDEFCAHIVGPIEVISTFPDESA